MSGNIPLTDPLPRRLLEGLRLLDALGDPLFVHDQALCIVYANAAYLERAGRPLRDVIDQPYWSVYPRHDGPLPGCHPDLRPEDGQEYRLPLQEGRALRSRAYAVRDAAGNVPYVIHLLEEVTEGEVNDLDALQRRNEALARETERLQQQLRELATTDALTGVCTRHEFAELARREISRLRRYGGQLSLLLVDIDHLRRINSRFGHAAGDRVINTVATLVKNNIRAADTVGRWEGGTLVVLAPAMELGEATGMAVKLRRILAGFGTADLGPVSASFGIAEHREGESEEALIGRAEAALCLAKERGRDRIETERALQRPVTATRH